MTPEVHYRTAEDYIGRAGREQFGSPEARYYLAQAQVHALLAAVPREVQQRAAVVGVTDP